ncbi:hypothetical protein HDV06_004381 [Boothiomyces sp. JEL0866]|nr:hypothetical protein HDV06_004381 [Boothiomyces sp. JEL0866]
MQYYKVLGISKNADEKEIKTAYKKLALKYHPDKNNDPGAAEKFKLVGEAYQVLIDPKRRYEYDTRGTSRMDMINPEDLFRSFFNDPFFGDDLGFKSRVNQHRNMFSNFRSSFDSDPFFNPPFDSDPFFSSGFSTRSSFSGMNSFPSGGNFTSRSTSTVIRNGRKETTTTITQNGVTTVEKEIREPDGRVTTERWVNGQQQIGGNDGKTLK